ncbi:hypothetical protein ACVBEF_07525 [Glaciimonas sp. GG7]
MTNNNLQPVVVNPTQFTVTAHSYDEVWKAAIRSVTRSLTIVDDDKRQGRIRAESNIGMMGGGEIVSVTISPAGRNAASYTIEVQSLQRSRLGLGSGPDWTRNIVAGIKAELGSVAPSGPVSTKDSLSPSEEIFVMPAPDRSP